MKAVLFDSYGRPEVLEVRDVDRPVPSHSEILVKIAAAAVNPKDCMVRKGKFKMITGRRFPKTTGYDLSGTVVEVGRSVEGFVVGDEVYGMINSWAGGAYAEYAALKVDETAHIPSTMSLADAAAVPLAAQTALQALRDLGELREGGRVLINGASGGVGTFAVQIAKLLGAEVWAVCSRRNHEMVAELGADTLVDYAKNPNLKFSQTFQVIFDVFGNRKFRDLQPMLDATGTHIGTIPTAMSFLLHAFSPLLRKKSRFVMVKSRRRDLEWLARHIKDGGIQAVIDRRYPLEQVVEAHRYIQTKRARGKVLLTL